MTGDSLRRDDLRPPETVKELRRTRVLWLVMFGGARHPSTRLYSKRMAARIAERFNRLYRVDVAHPDRFGKVTL